MKTDGNSIKTLLDDLGSALDRAFADAPDPQSQMRAVSLEVQFRGLLTQLPQIGGAFDPAGWNALNDAQKQPFVLQLETLAVALSEMIGPDGPPDTRNFMHRAYASTTSIFLLFAAAIVLTLIMLAIIVSFWPQATGTTAYLSSSSTNTTDAALQTPAPLAATNPPVPAGSRTNTPSSNIPPSAAPQMAGPLEVNIFKMIICMGALGGLLHLISSLTKYVGNRQLMRSWILYYWLMPVEGAALAPIVYLLLRVGVLGTPTNSSANATVPLNYLGLYAFAGLTGLFTKQALEMLGQVFSVIFQRVSGKDPLDKAGAKPPAGK